MADAELGTFYFRAVFYVACSFRWQAGHPYQLHDGRQYLSSVCDIAAAGKGIFIQPFLVALCTALDLPEAPNLQTPSDFSPSPDLKISIFSAG